MINWHFEEGRTKFHVAFKAAFLHSHGAFAENIQKIGISRKINEIDAFLLRQGNDSKQKISFTSHCSGKQEFIIIINICKYSNLLLYLCRNCRIE